MYFSCFNKTEKHPPCKHNMKIIQTVLGGGITHSESTILAPKLVRTCCTKEPPPEILVTSVSRTIFLPLRTPPMIPGRIFIESSVTALFWPRGQQGRVLLTKQVRKTIGPDLSNDEQSRMGQSLHGDVFLNRKGICHLHAKILSPPLPRAESTTTRELRH